MSTSPSPDDVSRIANDRRKAPTSVWAALWPNGRRLKNRRQEEHRLEYYVDIFPGSTLLLVILLLCLTLVDGVITLLLLQLGAEEINPVMELLLQRGPLSFLMGKYLMTAVGLPLLLIFKHHYLFRTRFRVGFLLPLFVGLYVVLIIYQISLLWG